MPVYEYKCKSCGREFEYQQRMSDPDKTECEACKGELERLISRTAFQLKGGGWYKDLYASTKPSGDSGSTSASTVKATEGVPSSSSSSDSSSSSSSSSDSSSSSSSGGDKSSSAPASAS